MEEKTDVEQVSSPVAPEESVAAEVAPQQEVDISGITATPAPGVGNEPVEEVDDKGVSYRNRAAEYQRKFEKQTDELSQIREALTQVQQNTSQQNAEPSWEDYEAYKTEHPEHAVHCAAKQKELERKAIISELRGVQEAENAEVQKQQAQQNELRSVVSTYPQMFNIDAGGRALGWNVENPLTQQTTAYLGQGHGLAVATKLAYADLAQQGLIQAGQQVATQQAQVGTLQRQVAVEGGGVNPGVVNLSLDAMNKVQQTGDKKAATQVLDSIFKRVGKLK